MFRDIGRIPATLIGVPLVTKFHAHFATETILHRVMKFLGFATEVQTGDPTFDATVYVTADHPMMMHGLSKDQELRQIIMNVLRQPGASVFCDGSHVWLKLNGDPEPALWTTHVRAIADRLSRVKTRFSDAFFVRAAIIEGLAYVPFIYWIGAALPFVPEVENLPNASEGLIVPGAIIAATWAGLTLILTRMLLSGSSRAPKIAIETGIVLLLSLPFAGNLAAHELNQALDSGKPVIFEGVVSSKFQIKSRRTRIIARTHRYYARMGEPIPMNNGQNVVAHIPVDRTLFDLLEIGDVLSISIGDGFFGVPWYRNIEIIGSSNTPNTKNR